MRPVTLAAGAVAVFMLAMALLVSAALPAPAAAATDHCMICHPQAHPDGWEQSHGTDLDDADVSETTCGDCHDASYCDGCHASAVQGPGSGS
jgi:hypothetical protein